MEAFRPLRTALCVYECMRLAFLVGVFTLLRPEGAAAFPWLALISPGALFLLMTLFGLLDMSLYRSYGPLYLAGKALSISSTIFWLFFAKSFMIGELFSHGMALLIVSGIFFFLALGDILSVWQAFIIMRSTGERR